MGARSTLNHARFAVPRASRWPSNRADRHAIGLCSPPAHILPTGWSAVPPEPRPSPKLRPGAVMANVRVLRGSDCDHGRRYHARLRSEPTLVPRGSGSRRPLLSPVHAASEQGWRIGRKHRPTAPIIRRRANTPPAASREPAFVTQSRPGTLMADVRSGSRRIGPSSTRRRAGVAGGRRTRTRRIGVKSAFAVPRRTSCHIDSADTGCAGSRNHAVMPRPSVGYAARSIAPWAAILARFVRPAATITQTDTEAGSQPRPSGDRPGQPPFSVHGPDQVVHVDDVGLELDDEKCAATRVPGEDVDHAAFAIDRERDLGLDRPRRQVVAEHPRDLLVQRGVPRVQ